MSKELAQQQTEWDLHENPETFIPLEFTEEIKPDLFGLELSKANEMVSGLCTTLAEREVLKNAYIDVIALEITSENLPIFKELRLKIVKNRTQGIEKWHKTNKAFYLAGGRFVDAVKNKEVTINEDMESKLMDAEKYFENLEKERLRLLNLERIEKIRPYVEDTTGLDFSEMNDYDFDDYVLGKKTRFENEQKAKKEAEEKAESDRVAEIERQKAIESENAKLKAEAEAKSILRSERAKLLQPYVVFIRDYNGLIEKEETEFQKELSEIKIGAEQHWQFELEERNKKARIEFEQQELQRKEFEKATEERLKKEAEIKAENERLAKEKTDKLEAEKLAKTPVKKQLSVWVESFEIPNISIDNETSKEIIAKFEAFKKWSINQINNL